MKYLLIFLYFFIQELSATTIYSNPAPWVGSDLNGLPCPQLHKGYGPYDYLQRDKYAHELWLVDSTHFHKDIENLIDKTRRTGDTQGDLHYTLNAWPNHHRALLSVIRYQIKLNNKLMRPIPLTSPPECYLQRAMNYSPKDPVPHSFMGYYLEKIGHLEQAIKHYENALTISPNNSKIEYSYSLLLIKLKQYDKALSQAKNAYQHGNPPSGLRNKLIKLGVWK